MVNNILLSIIRIYFDDDHEDTTTTDGNKLIIGADKDYRFEAPGITCFCRVRVVQSLVLYALLINGF